MVRNQRDEPIDTFTVTDWVDDPTISCNGAVAVIGDGLGTLIKALQDGGYLGGTTSA